MKDKVHRYQTDIMFYFLLLIVCSNINTLQVKTDSKMAPQETLNKVDFNVKNETPFSKSNLKQQKDKDSILSNDKSSSNFEFFKSVLTNLIKMDLITQKTQAPNHYETNDSTGSLNNYSIKEAFKPKSLNKLNFYNEAVKVAEVPRCDLTVCERENGICVSETQCKCNYGHINFVTGTSKKPCEYRLSFQLYALILEIFLPFGIGHFYCKRYLIGFIKFLVLLVIPALVLFINRKLLGNKGHKSPLNKVNRESSQAFSIENFKKFISYLISVCFFIVFFVWYLFDIVIFSANKHKDGSGFDLIPI